jgi:hypothetical protein
MRLVKMVWSLTEMKMKGTLSGQHGRNRNRQSEMNVNIKRL